MDPKEDLDPESPTSRADPAGRPKATRRDTDRRDDRDLDSVADLFALEQEAERTRAALLDRERALESISAECRRLEDLIEDRHLAYDGLKQEHERKLRALDLARQRIAQLEAELERLRSRETSGWAAPLADDTEPGRPLSPAWAIPVRSGVVALLVVASLAAGAGLTMLWSSLGTWWNGTRTPPALAERSEPTPSLSTPTEPGAAVEPEATTAPPAVVVGVRQDRLRDGSPGPLLMELAGGRFVMGRETPGAPDAYPAREVQVGAFLIGVHEVTFDDYDRFVRATGRRAPRDFGWGRGSRPVVDVDWSDAQAYLAWLSRETGQRYRLPSEAEWEFAAGGGSETSFWWGASVETGRAACFDCGSPWDGLSTAPVGRFPANPFGLYDTAGNVAEWVADCYRPNYEGAPLDARPWDQGACEFRVERGGSFARSAHSMRTFVRGRMASDTRLNLLGFRVARDP
ncbi:SUMF1/EgtB/PvdO family nonheme iron enzyme [Thioalkalicoccus limnaeus]|uniref:SUMF1/EgtB/PvdO family nonheme iron enzyme n=1 Tax=Thioalkalicoccus limnaeus TaxID=120681 RepID=A0ABV4B9Y9_9GAMM